MALSIIGTPGAGTGTSIALPTHAIGDLIVIFAYRDGSNTIPSKPAASGTVPAWVDIDTTAGGNTNSARSAYFVATATNHTSGTWTSATGMAVIVIRGAPASSMIGAFGQQNGAAANSATAPAITQKDTSGGAMILQFYGHRTVTAWSAAPSGYTRQASVATEAALNTKDNTTTDGSIAQANTASSSGYIGMTLEILPDGKRYWVGGTGTWNATTTHWAAASGGTAGAPVPTATDDVFIDGNSGGGTVSTNTTTAFCKSIDFTGFAGTFNLLGASIQVNGDIKLSTGMTMGNPNGDWQMRGSVTQNITSNGKTFTSSGGPFYLLHTGTVKLLDAFVTDSFVSHGSGTFDANNQNVTCAAWVSSNTTTRTITMGSGTWLLTATGTVWDITDPTNLTLNANTSTIKVTDDTGDINFIGGGKTYNNLWFATGANAGIITIDGSNTFADFKDTGTADHTIKFTDGTTQTVASLTIAAGSQRTLTGTSTGGWTISKSSGTVSVNNCSISYSAATGGAIWDAFTANGNVDSGNNSGWIFSPTSIKNVMGLATASVKTVDDLAISNVKSIDDLQ